MEDDVLVDGVWARSLPFDLGRAGPFQFSMGEGGPVLVLGVVVFPGWCFYAIRGRNLLVPTIEREEVESS
jgi:hypothetical protein